MQIQTLRGNYQLFVKSSTWNRVDSEANSSPHEVYTDRLQHLKTVGKDGLTFTDSATTRWTSSVKNRRDSYDGVDSLSFLWQFNLHLMITCYCTAQICPLKYPPVFILRYLTWIFSAFSAVVKRILITLVWPASSDTRDHKENVTYHITSI